RSQDCNSVATSVSKPPLDLFPRLERGFFYGRVLLRLVSQRKQCPNESLCSLWQVLRLVPDAVIDPPLAVAKTAAIDWRLRPTAVCNEWLLPSPISNQGTDFMSHARQRVV